MNARRLRKIASRVPWLWLAIVQTPSLHCQKLNFTLARNQSLVTFCANSTKCTKNQTVFDQLRAYSLIMQFLRTRCSTLKFTGTLANESNYTERTMHSSIG